MHESVKVISLIPVDREQGMRQLPANSHTYVWVTILQVLIDNTYFVMRMGLCPSHRSRTKQTSLVTFWFVHRKGFLWIPAISALSVKRQHVETTNLKALTHWEGAKSEHVSCKTKTSFWRKMFLMLGGGRQIESRCRENMAFIASDFCKHICSL